MRDEGAEWANWLSGTCVGCYVPKRKKQLIKRTENVPEYKFHSRNSILVKTL